MKHCWNFEKEEYYDLEIVETLGCNKVRCLGCYQTRIMKEHCNCPDCCCGDKDCSGKEFLEKEEAEQ